ncbi:DNA-directed RNA polymerase subunit beta [Striga asiatica]|uniref:DNA-directed RNA polymerase subunit beta n=1 Tax=Striga asiatica TaxID=4170 RepID=A0A5A7PCQ8_STRAF|nr:DNA-directed RNA polymerase subunit beta [Striga asiatica]
MGPSGVRSDGWKVTGRPRMRSDDARDKGEVAAGGPTADRGDVVRDSTEDGVSGGVDEYLGRGRREEKERENKSYSLRTCLSSEDLVSSKVGEVGILGSLGLNPELRISRTSQIPVVKALDLRLGDGGQIPSNGDLSSLSIGSGHKGRREAEHRRHDRPHATGKPGLGYGSTSGSS